MNRPKRESARICLSCDKTCLSCNGSNPNECTSCYPGSQLRALQDEGKYCHSFTERSSGNNYGIGIINSEEPRFEEPNGNVSSAVFVLVVIPGVIILLGVAVLVVYRNFFFGNSTNSYIQVAFDNDSKDDFEHFIEEEDEESENEMIN